MAASMPKGASALPFNDDMVHNAPKTSEIMRPAPKGSVPLGSAARHVTQAQAVTLTSPIPADEGSLRRGKRLWSVNCAACHGIYRDGAFHRAVPEDTTGLILRNFADPTYWNTSAPGYFARSDGYIFNAIHFGFARMPRYGWKLSVKEHWDIVNYLKSTWVDLREASKKDAG